MIKTNLAVLLAERGLKIADVYKATGISKTTLMAISENSGKGIQYDTMDKLCSFLEVEPKDFFVYSPYMVSFSELKYNDFIGLYVDCILKNGEYEKTKSLQIAFNDVDELKEIYKYDFVLSIDANIDEFYTSLPIQLKRDFRTNLIENVLYAISHASLSVIPENEIENEIDFISKVRRRKINKRDLNSFVYLNLGNNNGHHLYLECTIKVTNGDLTLNWFNCVTCKIFGGWLTMKKGLTIAVSVFAALSLAACGSSSAKSSGASSTSSAKTTSHKTKHHKKAADKKKSSKSSSSSAASASSNQGQQAQTATSQQGGQQATQSTGQQASQPAGHRVNNVQDALNAARAKYGDNGGDYQWVIMQNGETGQPAQNPDGSYFIKAISRNQLNNGSMTGTAQSVNVYPDGTIVSN